MIYKHLALIFLIAGLGTIASAQQRFFYEDFGNGIPPGWSSVVLLGNGQPDAAWQHTTVGPVGPFSFDTPPLASTTAGNGWALFDSDQNCNMGIGQNAWLITPAIDASNLGAVWIRFQTIYRRFLDVARIRVGYDLNNLNSWAAIPVFPGVLNGRLGGPSNQNPVHKIIDLSPHAAGRPVVYIAFQFLSDVSTSGNNPNFGCAYSWQIDDVELFDGFPGDFYGNSLIAGRLAIDVNCDGIVESTEPAARNILVFNDERALLGVSNSEGVFNIFVAPGSTTVFAPADLPGFIFSPTQYELSADSIIQYYSGYDFAYCPNGSFSNVAVTLVETSAARPGFQATYALCASNYGAEPVNALLRFYSLGNAASQYTEIIDAQDGMIIAGGDTAEWLLLQIPPFEQRCVVARIQILPSTPLGTVFSWKAEIAPLAGEDIDAPDNQSNIRQVVTGSYDPNDKLVDKAEIDFSALDGGVELNYTIRFQNTGTDTAFTVIVRDTISNRLDINTFKHLAASHLCNVHILPGNVVQWHFPDILLVDSTTNEPLSHGFIRFSIRSQPDVQLGETLRNRAGIYFDYNEPIITNNATSSFFIVNTQDYRNSMEVKAFPNPFSGRVQLAFSAAQPGLTIQVFDAFGQLVRRGVWHGATETELSIPGPVGIYFIHLRNNAGESAVLKVLKIKE